MFVEIIVGRDKMNSGDKNSIDQLWDQARAIATPEQWKAAVLVYEEQYQGQQDNPAFRDIGNILVARLVPMNVEDRCDTFCEIVPQASNSELLLSMLIIVTREAKHAQGLAMYLLSSIKTRLQMDEEMKRLARRYHQQISGDILGGNPYEGYYPDALIAAAKAAKAEYLSM